MTSICLEHEWVYDPRAHQPQNSNKLYDLKCDKCGREDRLFGITIAEEFEPCDPESAQIIEDFRLKIVG